MAENRKKRKWLSTQTLKEFINDITEEELNAEEFNNDTKPIRDEFDLGDTSEDLSNESKSKIKTNSEEEQRTQKFNEHSSDEISIQQTEIQYVTEKLKEIQKESENRVSELKMENDTLKEKLDFERTRLKDELKSRDEDWSKKNDVTEEKRKSAESMIVKLQQQLEDKESNSMSLKELTLQVEEYKKKYHDLQIKDNENKKKLSKSEAKIIELEAKVVQFDDLNKQFHQLEQNYQQLQIDSQENEKKLVELQAESDMLDEMLDEKDQEFEVISKNLKVENANYKVMLQQLEDQINQKNKKTMGESQLAIDEKDQISGEQSDEEMIENMEQLVVEKEDLSKALFDAQEAIAKLEEKTSNLEELEIEKERLAQRLTGAQNELDKLKEQNHSEESLGMINMKKQVDELTENNEKLKLEVVQSQQEIGEVLISAKKQAKKTVEEAQIEAKHLVSSAELELENISNRAKKILIEVSESRKNVLSLYDDLEFKVEALSSGALLKEIKKNKRGHKLSDYFD